MRILICDDEALYRFAIQQSIEQWKKHSQHEDVEIALYRSTEELWEFFSEHMNADLLFLDIQIPHEINGIELARKIRSVNNHIAIVFITNYDEFVYEGYSVNALRYLRKPIVNEEVFFCCSYVYNRLSLSLDNCISLSSNSQKYVFRHDEIIYIEAQSHTMYIHVTGYDHPIRIHGRLIELSKILPNRLFVFCHRSYIVNLSHIRVLTRTKIVLTDGSLLPVSRGFSEKLNQCFDNYFRGGSLRDGYDHI